MHDDVDSPESPAGPKFQYYKTVSIRWPEPDYPANLVVYEMLPVVIPCITVNVIQRDEECRLCVAVFKAHAVHIHEWIDTRRHLEGLADAWVKETYSFAMADWGTGAKVMPF